MAAVEGAGRVIGWIPTQTSRDVIEVARSDLASILIGDVVLALSLYGDTVVGLEMMVRVSRCGSNGRPLDVSTW